MGSRSVNPRVAAAVTAASLLLAGCSDGNSKIEVGAKGSTTSTSAGRTTTTADTGGTTTSASDSPAPSGARPDYYLEETRPSTSKVTLVLHSGADDSVVRDAYTTGTYAHGDDPAASPILDAEVAPDGTVYVVERTDVSEDGEMRPGGTRLARIADDGTATTVKANVTTSELSPDGTRMAVTILSPDGNGDGKGTQALRIIDMPTGATDELWSADVALDAQGVITQETGHMEVVAWIGGQTTLVVEEGCCDSGSVMLVPSSSARGGSPDTWPRVDGDHATYALGLADDGRVLVQRDTFTGDGVNVPAELSGIEIVAMADDGTSAPVYTQPLDPSSGSEEDSARYDLVGTKVAGTPLPIAFEGSNVLFGASDERTRRRFA